MEGFNIFCFAVIEFMLYSTTFMAITEEPMCTSRFDYEHKLLHKMIMLEIEQNKVKDRTEELSKVLQEQKEDGIQERSTLDNIVRRLTKMEKIRSSDGTGNTYVRWGRTQCPENGTELVYRGYAAGSHYNDQGASSNYLCLPEEPLWDVYEDSEQAAGTVWGAEYELHSRNMDNFFRKKVLDQDVPCAVCRTMRTGVLMIPGRNKCFDGWTLEYGGYLSSGHVHHHASEFVCLDRDPEVFDGGASNENGKLFYFVEARCGSLRCPPYVNGRELTCAVCSK
ncbi:uncharacterized protein LOC123532371 [Mercenaria mercenaria]|uniref:uncharacterized protein LOC123532371 n=1 Tax=Mercenaria mercenaria TaxID=6596 RepID=UPI00234E5F88|nr:uncharacterized protein LOC123532371 [Mercenaria mercenaria]